MGDQMVRPNNHPTRRCDHANQMVHPNNHPNPPGWFHIIWSSGRQPCEVDIDVPVGVALSLTHFASGMRDGFLHRLGSGLPALMPILIVTFCSPFLWVAWQLGGNFGLT